MLTLERVYEVSPFKVQNVGRGASHRALGKGYGREQ